MMKFKVLSVAGVLGAAALALASGSALAVECPIKIGGLAPRPRWRLRLVIQIFALDSPCYSQYEADSAHGTQNSGRYGARTGDFLQGT